MQLLDEHLFTLFREGIIAGEEAIDKCNNPGEMSDKVEAMRRGRPHVEGEEKPDEDLDTMLRK